MLPLASRIERVTVFRSGARVVRVAELDAEAARAERVRLVRLPLSLDDASVRARVEGEGAATDVRVALEVPEPDPALAPPRDEELRAAANEVARLRAEVERVEAMLARVAQVQIAPRPLGKEGEPPIASPVAARRALVALRTEEHARLCEELADHERALLAAERVLASLKERAARATTARNAREHELTKSLAVALAGPARGVLRVEYLVPGARWAPSYALSLGARVIRTGALPASELAGAGKSAELVVRAAVAQRTGEDWSGARLVLSTADPEKWGELPDLKSVRIGRAQRGRPPRGWREPPIGALELYADYDRAFGAPERAAPAREPSDDEVTAPGVSLRALEEEDAMTIVMGDKELTRDAIPGAYPPAPRPAAGLPPPAMGGAPRSAVPDGRARAGTGAPPPPAAHAMLVAPAAAPPPGAPAQTFGAPRMMKSAAPPRRPPVPPPPGPAGLDLEALAYGRLRMLDAASGARGVLVAASSAQLYAEALGGGVSVSFDVLAAVRIAVQRASLEASAPPGYDPVPRSNDFDYAYEAKLPVDVPSDGAFHVIHLATYATDARVSHVTVPRESQDVFRVVELTSPLDAALPRGPIDVYQRGTYLMTTRLPPTPPHGKVRLGLGVEQAIKVARNTSFAEKSTGLLGGGLALHHEIEIDLSNVLDRPVELEVRERVPVHRDDDKDIEIAIEHVEPTWKEWTQEQSLKGGYRWMVTLDPGEKKRLVAKYAVKIASKLELVGGNRREVS